MQFFVFSDEESGVSFHGNRFYARPHTTVSFVVSQPTFQRVSGATDLFGKIDFIHLSVKSYHDSNRFLQAFYQPEVSL